MVRFGLIDEGPAEMPTAAVSYFEHVSDYEYVNYGNTYFMMPASAWYSSPLPWSRSIAKIA